VKYLGHRAAGGQRRPVAVTTGKRVLLSEQKCMKLMWLNWDFGGGSGGGGGGPWTLLD